MTIGDGKLIELIMQANDAKNLAHKLDMARDGLRFIAYDPDPTVESLKETAIKTLEGIYQLERRLTREDLRKQYPDSFAGEKGNE